MVDFSENVQTAVIDTRPPLAPRQRQANTDVRQYRNLSGRMVTITFEIHEEFAPALRSAIDEISNEIGGRLEAPHSYAKQDALTRAAIGLGRLRAAVNAAVRRGDPDYA